MYRIHRFWRDQRGEVSMSSVLLLTVILAIGAIVGLTTLRDQLVQEFGDVGVALESLNQSYSSAFGTFTDPGTTLTDPAGAPPACIAICSVNASDEGP